jgi:hypothetical protein
MGTKYFAPILLVSLFIVNLTAGEENNRKTISKFDFKKQPGLGQQHGTELQKKD